jgi:hypothetical protein
MQERLSSSCLAVSMIKVRAVKDRQISTNQQTADDSTCPEVMIISGQ